MYLIDWKALKKLPALSIRSRNKSFFYPEPVLIRCDFEKSFKEQVRWSVHYQDRNQPVRSNLLSRSVGKVFPQRLVI